MTTLALAPKLPDPRLFSIVTIAEEGGPAAWHSRMRWPRHGDAHIALDMNRPRRAGVWASQIDDAVMQADRAVLLVAEGVGCFAASWWARLSPSHYVSKVAGALMFDPASPPRDADARQLFASPAIQLPFPSILLTPDDAELRDDAALGAQVDSWGSRRVAGSRQRTVDQSAWWSAQRLVNRFTRAIVEHDVQRAHALRGE